MSIRFVLPALACASLAAPALAQSQPAPEIDYRTGQYEYAQSPDDGDDVVTETLPATTVPLPAVRIIPMRQTGPAPVFVSNPVIQSIEPAQAVHYVQTAPVVAVAPNASAVYNSAVLQPAPVIYPYPIAPIAPVAYGYSAGGASRVIYPAGGAQPAYAYSQAYSASPSALPAGSQLVYFESAVWLAECRNRLAGYAPEDREAAVAALGGAAAGYAPGSDYCASYLDSYMASAAAGTLMVAPQYGQQYMLVPVTVLTAQAAARRAE